MEPTTSHDELLGAIDGVLDDNSDDDSEGGSVLLSPARPPAVPPPSESALAIDGTAVAFRWATFGGPPHEPFAGKVIWSVPADANGDVLLKPEYVAGNVCVVRSGGCSFHKKAEKLQACGAGAVIILNAPLEEPFSPGGPGATAVTIPVIGVSGEEEIQEGAAVQLTLGAADRQWRPPRAPEQSQGFGSDNFQPAAEGQSMRSRLGSLTSAAASATEKAKASEGTAKAKGWLSAAKEKAAKATEQAAATAREMKAAAQAVAKAKLEALDEQLAQERAASEARVQAASDRREAANQEEAQQRKLESKALPLWHSARFDRQAMRRAVLGLVESPASFAALPDAPSAFEFNVDERTVAVVKASLRGSAELSAIRKHEVEVRTSGIGRQSADTEIRTEPFWRKLHFHVQLTQEQGNWVRDRSFSQLDGGWGGDLRLGSGVLSTLLQELLGSAEELVAAREAIDSGAGEVSVKGGKGKKRSAEVQAAVIRSTHTARALACAFPPTGDQRAAADPLRQSSAEMAASLLVEEEGYGAEASSPNAWKEFRLPLYSHGEREGLTRPGASACKATCSGTLTSVLAAQFCRFDGLSAKLGFWAQICSELEWHWTNSVPLPSISPGQPDFSTCVLHQTVQALDGAIRAELCRAALQASESELGRDCPCTLARDASHKGAEGAAGGAESEQRKLRSGEGMWVPLLPQTSALYLPEAAFNEQSSTGGGVGMAALKSDIESFKAANPTAVFEDFIAYYSPNDLNADGSLSTRMSADSDWMSMWENAQPIAAKDQPPLVDNAVFAADFLAILRGYGEKPELLFLQLLPCCLESAWVNLYDASQGMRPVRAALDQLGAGLGELAVAEHAGSEEACEQGVEGAARARLQICRKLVAEVSAVEAKLAIAEANIAEALAF